MPKQLRFIDLGRTYTVATHYASGSPGPDPDPEPTGPPFGVASPLFAYALGGNEPDTGATPGVNVLAGPAPSLVGSPGFTPYAMTSTAVGDGAPTAGLDTGVTIPDGPWTIVVLWPFHTGGAAAAAASVDTGEGLIVGADAYYRPSVQLGSSAGAVLRTPGEGEALDAVVAARGAKSVLQVVTYDPAAAGGTLAMTVPRGGGAAPLVASVAGVAGAASSLVGRTWKVLSHPSAEYAQAGQARAASAYARVLTAAEIEALSASLRSRYAPLGVEIF